MAADKERAKLLSLFGDLPPRDYMVFSRLIDKEVSDGMIREKLVLDLNGIEPVPALFILPQEVTGKIPVVLYNHSHGGRYHVGKSEVLTGAPYLYEKPYAQELTAAGYGVLAIDAWGFGERRGRTEQEIFKEMLWKGQAMWGMMVYDSIKAVDYLLTRTEVDPDRIGTLGMSMGGTMAWWTAALDQRIKVCVDLCAMTDFHSLIETGGLDRHSIYYYVPNLLKYFTTAAINTLICPRPHLSLNGVYDRITPEQGLDRVKQELEKVYDAAGVKDRFVLKKYSTGHLETAAMRKEAMAFLRQWL